MSEAASNTLQFLDVPLDLNSSILESKLGQFGPLKRCFVVKPKKNHKGKFTKGIVEFLVPSDASKCLESLPKGQLILENDGEKVKLKASFAGQRQDKKSAESENSEKKEFEATNDWEQRRFDSRAAKAKKSRLVVRNLSFKASEEQLRDHFSKCGQVKDVHILLKPDGSGRRVGCAFVQFGTVAEAALAIKKLNRSSILDRPIAVDWAVAKAKFQDPSNNLNNKVAGNSDNFDPDNKEGIKDEPLDQDEIKTEIKEEGDDEDDMEVDQDDSDGDESAGGSGEDSDISDDEDEPKPKKSRKDWPKTGHDVGENRTVFLRNLSFDSEEDDLRAMMRETFGPVYFARLVMDKVTEHPKGTAFVKFVEPEAVQRCVDASNSKEGLWLDNRQIYANPAISKEDADETAKKKKEKIAKDNRNLHLAVEGLIRPGTKAAIGVSKTDMEKRTQVEKWKRMRLKDLNIFVSPTRLCVRNFPLTYKDSDLKKLFIKHLLDKKSKLTEAKVIKDLKNGNSDSSKGYGFVTFANHEEALNGLRCVNNNPSVFGKSSRPIVEFSLENKKAVNARIKRHEKSVTNNPLNKKLKFHEKSEKQDEAIDKKAGKKDKKAKKSKAENGDEYQRKESKERLEDKADFVGSIHDPKQRNLPSHSGPKIRHKARPGNGNESGNGNSKAISRKDLSKLNREKKRGKKRKLDEDGNGNESVAATNGSVTESKGNESEPKKKKKNKKKKFSKAATKDFKEEKQFNELVNKYKNKMGASDSSSVPLRQKWFN